MVKVWLLHENGCKIPFVFSNMTSASAVMECLSAAAVGEVWFSVLAVPDICKEPESRFIDPKENDKKSAPTDGGPNSAIAN